MSGQRRWLYQSSLVPDQRFALNVPSGRNTHTVYLCKRRDSSTRARSLQVMVSATLHLPSWGYHLITQKRGEVELAPNTDAVSDDLSFTSGFGHTFVERASSPHSRIVDLQNPQILLPMMHVIQCSPLMGRDLAFLRDDRGRGQIMLRRAFQLSSTETQHTPPQLNVYEASFLSDQKYAFSADENGSSPRIFLTDATHSNAPIMVAESPVSSTLTRWAMDGVQPPRSWCLESLAKGRRQRLVSPHRRRTMQPDPAVMGKRLKNFTLRHRLRQKRMVYRHRSSESSALISY